MRTKTVTVPAQLKAGGEGGTVTAAFAVYRDGAGQEVIDSAGDVTLPSAFTHGQEVGMCWSHDWSKIIGKGKVGVERDRATFTGEFFATPTAQEARETIRGLGPLGQWSFGYQVLESAPGTVRGQSVTILKRIDLLEVSAVLVGANRQTSTLAIKNGAGTTTAPSAGDRGRGDPEASPYVHGPVPARVPAGYVLMRESPPTELDRDTRIGLAAVAEDARRRLQLPELHVRYYCPASDRERNEAALLRTKGLAPPWRWWLEERDLYAGHVFAEGPTDAWVEHGTAGRMLDTLLHEAAHVRHRLGGWPTATPATRRYAEADAQGFTQRTVASYARIGLPGREEAVA